MSKVAIFDLDGVMNSISDARAHLVPENTDRADHWAEWHKAHVKEKVNPVMVAVVRALFGDGWGIMFISNRISTCDDTTFVQLSKAGLIGVDYAFKTRRPLDNTPPVEYKVEAIRDAIHSQSLIEEDVDYMVFDDDPKVINALAGDDSTDFTNLTTVCVQTYKG